MDTVADLFGPYYQAKAREIPRTSSITSGARQLWREMEDAAHACAYSDGSYEYLDECIQRLANHPGCDWKVSTLNYWVRHTYFK